ncbi:Desmethyl-deoxy-podophyllotoxin synthase [Linum perenne]
MELTNYKISSSEAFILTFIILLSFTIWQIIIKPKSNPKTHNLPPGPLKLPFIGNIHQLIGYLPHRRLNHLSSKHGPLIHLQLGQVSTVIVSSPETAKHVLKTHDINFANRPFILAAKVLCYQGTDIVCSPYGEYWRQTKRVRSYRSIREDETAKTVKDIMMNSVGNEKGVVNLTHLIYSLTNRVTARAAFGKMCVDGDEFLVVAKEAGEAGGGFSLADMYPYSKWVHVFSGMEGKLFKIREKASRILDRIIEEHRDKRRSRKDEEGDDEEDLVDVLLRVQENGEVQFPLPGDDCLKSVIMDIFTAGTDASSTTLEWTIAELLRHNEALKKAQQEVRQVFGNKEVLDELSFLKLVIKEALRLHPPAPLLLPRQNSEACKIDGYDIPPKTKVIVNAWAMGRDPKHWKDPNEFIPERFVDEDCCSADYKGTNLAYIPFGAGRRICPGIAFGMANVELPLASLLYHFDWKSSDGTKLEDMDMSESFGIAVKKKRNMFLIPVPYCPSTITN